jgi:hypothetical protein
MSSIAAELEDQRGHLGFAEREIIDHAAEQRHRTEFEPLRIDPDLEERILDRDNVFARQAAEKHLFASGLVNLVVSSVGRVQDRQGVFFRLDAKLLRAHLHQVAGVLDPLQFQTRAPHQTFGWVNCAGRVQIAARTFLRLNLLERRGQGIDIVQRDLLELLNQRTEYPHRRTRHEPSVFGLFDEITFGLWGKQHTK